MARRKAKRGAAKGRKKAGRRPAARKAVRKAKPAASAGLAKAKARIAQLEAENRRLRADLAGRNQPVDAEPQDDGPLAPGM
jgi:hypothetical protein